ncbi:MAG: RiPP maturation radical SAM C-methyltransferase [Acidobacteriota bacterium]
MDCCLVNMPFVDVRRPSLALGLLQAALEADGLAARTVYGNLLFCEYVGLPAMQLTVSSAWNQLGDWVFSLAAFPDFEPDQRQFSKYFVERGMNLTSRTGRVARERMFERILRLATHMRTKVDGYLDGLVDEVLRGNPRIVGCSSMVIQHVASLALLRRIRERAPDVVTMLGGANCESIMGVATHRNFPWVDFVVSGEADHLIGPLVRSILSHGRDVPPSDLTPGVFGPVHRVAGYPVGEDGSPPRAVVVDMTSIPPPNYDDYFSTIERGPGLRAAVRPTLSVQTSRGCWWHAKGGCTFCSLSGQGTAFRSVDPPQVVRLLRQMVERYHVRSFAMVDNIIDPRHVEALPPLLKGDDLTRDCRFFYETRTSLQPHQLRSLGEAGVRWLLPGIESLSTELLRLMNKGCQAWQNIQFLKACLRYGMMPFWNVLHGFPLEQDVWYREMASLMPLLHHLPRPTTFAPLQIGRFSAYHSNPERFGLKLVPLRDYFYTYPLGRTEIEQLAYYFEDEREAAFAGNPMHELLDGEGLDAARRAVCGWTDSWTPIERRPVLTVAEMDGCLLIRDTRKIAVAERHELRGTKKEIYQTIESGPPRESVTAMFARRGIAGERIEEGIRELVELRLAIEIDGRLLSLAVPEPVWPLPADIEDIRGAFVVRQFIAARKNAKRN